MATDAKGLAETLGVNERTIQRLCRDRRIEHMRVGKALRFTQQQVQDAIDYFTVEPQPPEDPEPPQNPAYIRRVVPLR